MQMRFIEHVEQRVLGGFASTCMPGLSALAEIMLRLLSNRIAHRRAISHVTCPIMECAVSKKCRCWLIVP
jgi:hypothetical protein